jgi:hypothetical protein
MPKHYQGESENSTASKKERMKIKKKKEERDAPPVRRGLKNPNALFKKLQMQLNEKGRKEAEKIPYSPEWYKKQDKVNRNKS